MSGQESDKVVRIADLPPAQTVPGGGNGNGGGFAAWRASVDARLANLERDVATLMERTKHLATREDLQRMQTEMLALQNRHMKWIIGGMGAALLAALAALATALFQLFSGG